MICGERKKKCRAKCRASVGPLICIVGVQGAVGILMAFGDAPSTKGFERGFEYRTTVERSPVHASGERNVFYLRHLSSRLVAVHHESHGPRNRRCLFIVRRFLAGSLVVAPGRGGEPGMSAKKLA